MRMATRGHWRIAFFRQRHHCTEESSHHLLKACWTVNVNYTKKEHQAISTLGWMEVQLYMVKTRHVMYHIVTTLLIFPASSPMSI